MSVAYANEAYSGSNSLKHAKESHPLFRRSQRRSVIGFSVIAAVCFALSTSALVISILVIARPPQSADNSEIQELKNDLNQFEDALLSLNVENGAFKSQQTNSSTALVESKAVEKLAEKLDSEIAKVKTLINETHSSLAVLTRKDQEIDNRMNSYHKKGLFFKSSFLVAMLFQGFLLREEPANILTSFCLTKVSKSHRRRLISAVMRVSNFYHCTNFTHLQYKLCQNNYDSREITSHLSI